MARIAEAEIERLKREVAVERLAAARGVELERHGADLIGRCPFHDDHTPSLVISPQKNLWHCLGACRAGGSAIDWVMKAEGVSFRHAVELLLKDHLPLAASGGGTPPQRSVNYTYDLASRRATLLVVGQAQVSYTWDNANRLTGINQGSSGVGLAYDNANRRTTLTLPNGVTASYGYDPDSCQRRLKVDPGLLGSPK
jgi:hypothetical protein